MVRATGRDPSIPRADRATPYIPAYLKAYPIVPAMQRIGTMQELYPRASPWMMFGAGPITHASASLLTGV
jgi:hypothetical protein